MAVVTPKVPSPTPVVTLPNSTIPWLEEEFIIATSDIWYWLFVVSSTEITWYAAWYGDT